MFQLSESCSGLGPGGSIIQEGSKSLIADAFPPSVQVAKLFWPKFCQLPGRMAIVAKFGKIFLRCFMYFLRVGKIIGQEITISKNLSENANLYWQFANSVDCGQNGQHGNMQLFKK